MSQCLQKREMVSLAKSLFDRGYSVGGAGNISIRLDDKHILITPTGSSLGRLTPDTLSIITLDGELVSGHPPSKEYPFHLAIYAKKPECQAIVHLHSSYLTALSCLENLNPDNAIKPFTPYYVMRVGSLPVIPYFAPGDVQIATQLSRLASHHNAFLLANHGVVVCGKHLQDAVDNAEELEETAKLMFILDKHQVRYLSNDEIQVLNQRRK
ncbi:3-oxo-tetronate 4-phosphate decarboxylase [Spirabiliibacterium falconis]|uniref:3-oxo-tetronate 4-phosphate decarboxylase n=1 Tax=Spirabiliibacterium falconis TaxID=572023 RepID=UPI001AADDEFB|nr:aldolase [Spirabiliibacterium falconis]MBE2894566.1 aldolase [Spirabiliibacterium falconis]